MKTSTQHRWEALRARLAAASKALSAFESDMRFKYGNVVESWMTQGERTKLKTLRRKCSSEEDKIIALLVKFSPRGEAWLSGVPAAWLCEELTFEDAARPLTEPLSVKPPYSYGYGPRDVREIDR